MSFRSHPLSGPDEHQRRAYFAGSTFRKGAPLIVHTDGTWKECAADPATVAAIAAHDVGTGSGAEYPIGYKEFPPLEAIALPLKPGSKWIAEYVGTPAEGNFGSVKGADGVWRVDFTETTTAQWKFVKSYAVAPLSIPLVEMTIITSVIGAA